VQAFLGVGENRGVGGVEGFKPASRVQDSAALKVGGVFERDSDGTMLASGQHHDGALTGLRILICVAAVQQLLDHWRVPCHPHAIHVWRGAPGQAPDQALPAAAT
jgi:hypothetical protein